MAPRSAPFPTAGVIFDKWGNLYGTTSGGGTNGLGVIYKLAPPSGSGGAWTETVVYNFAYNNQGGTTGRNAAGLIQLNGALYCATTTGGNGNGNVVELRQNTNGSWGAKQIYSFTGGSDGANPLYDGGALIHDNQGNLYGTTLTGSGGYGTVFELSPPATRNGAWTFSVLYTFNNYNGPGSLAPLVLDGTGNLYGTSGSTGLGSAGAVFELSPALGGGWTPAVLYSFSYGIGWDPTGGLILDKSGNIYGTASRGGANTGWCENTGCGVVFKISNSGGAWTETVLHQFTDGVTDGASPFTGLVMDPTGDLYGVTPTSGAYDGGAFYKVAP